MILLLGCSTNREARVDDLFKNYSGTDVPGAAVMVVQNGTPIMVKAYGMADLQAEIPVSRKSNFRLASVSKQFTAMCIMMLKERGALQYSTKLTDIFPEFPDYGNKITIRRLLQHRSGLVAYESLLPDTTIAQVRDEDVRSMLMTQDSTYFEPGSAYRYSNTGYALLAEIVAKVSQKSFADFLHENIFDPLDMHNTVAFENGVTEVSQRAFGYTVKKDSVLFSDQSRTSAVLGDGGIYSSLDDLLKWDQALYTETLVSDETLAEAFSPALEKYGFGWRIDEFGGYRRLHHTGSTSGFRTVIQRFPEQGFTVVILTNRSTPGVGPLAERLVDLYLLND